MRIVVADTGPLRYLAQIDQIELLPRLFEKIFIPSIVSDELRHPSAPEAVRKWIGSKPSWLDISVVSSSDDPWLGALDQGERSAIAERLASEPEIPQLSVSVGVAVYPVNGDSVEKLLGAADCALYRMKESLEGTPRFSRAAAR